VERQSDDYSGEAELYEDVVPSDTASEQAAEDLSNQQEWQGGGLESEEAVSEPVEGAEDGEEPSLLQSESADLNSAQMEALEVPRDTEMDTLRVPEDAEGSEYEEKEQESGEIEQTEVEEIERKQAEDEELARKQAEDMEIERREEEKREIERKEAEKREIEQKEAEKREIEQKEAEKREIEQKEAEKREIEQKEAEKREIERKEEEKREIQRKEEENREIEQRKIEQIAAEQKEIERLQSEKLAKEAEFRELEIRKQAELEREREEMESKERERLKNEQLEREKKAEELRQLEKQRERDRLEFEQRERERIETEQREKDRKDAELREKLESELRERQEAELREQLEAQIRKQQLLKAREKLRTEQEKPAEISPIPSKFELEYVSPSAFPLQVPRHPSLLPLKDSFQGFSTEAERHAIEDPLEAQILDFYARTPDDAIASGDNSEFDPLIADSEPQYGYSHREDNAAFRTTSGSSIHQRLYEEAYKRRMLQTRYEQAKYEGDLKECTFQPGSARAAVTNGVHNRLYQRAEEDRVKEQVYLRRKLEQEMSGCTFTPALGHIPNRTISPGRLYEDAERKRCTREPPAVEQTARPAVYSKPTNAAIYEKLYNSSNSQATKLRKQQLEREMQATQGVTFSPRVNPHKQEPAALPAHERLYLLNEEMLKRLESKRMAQRTDSAVRREVGDEEPRYEALYMDGAKRQRKQAALQARVDFELGINFMPRTNLHAAHPSA
jgi:hypothetical protein